MTASALQSWTWVGSIQWSGWVTKFSVLSESGPVSKICDKCTIYTQETDYLTAIIIHNDKKF